MFCLSLQRFKIILLWLILKLIRSSRKMERFISSGLLAWLSSLIRLSPMCLVVVRVFLTFLYHTYVLGNGEHFIFRTFIPILMRKEVFKFVVKVLLYALGLIASYLGITSLTSCTVQRASQSSGHARIVIVDTTDIVHDGNFYFRPGRRRLLIFDYD